MKLTWPLSTRLAHPSFTKYMSLTKSEKNGITICKERRERMCLLYMCWTYSFFSDFVFHKTCRHLIPKYKITKMLILKVYLKVVFFVLNILIRKYPKLLTWCISKYINLFKCVSMEFTVEDSSYLSQNRQNIEDVHIFWMMLFCTYKRCSV